MLRDAAQQHRGDVEVLADFLRIIFAIFEAEDGAARHHFDVRQLRKRADQAFGEAVAEIFVVWVGGGVDEGQHRDGGDFLRRRAATDEIVAADDESECCRHGSGNPEFAGAAGMRSRHRCGT